MSQTQPKNPSVPTPKKLEGVKNIIAVASGKGGVGKSTVAVNLAYSLNKQGYNVGLVDVDIHGPSVAHMVGTKEKPQINENLMTPHDCSGVKCISMGMLSDEDTPIVWRGPMLSKGLKQLIFQVNWGELDFLVMDLPPGTGDVQLSMAQNVCIDGVVIVTTPQEVALIDVKKAVNMFQKVNIPIIGSVENMSFFKDPTSGEEINIFGTGNAKKLQEKYGIENLTSIPINPAICTSGDDGVPYMLQNNSDDITTCFETLSTEIAKYLQ